MGFTSDEMRQFVEAVRGEPEHGECVTRGTVTRVDPDGTAWVQIGQNAEPTPCGMDVSARVGDIVTVRIANHRATVTGNSTSPATDDRTAMEAHGVATAAKASADVAQEAASGAQEAAASAATTARAAETAAGEAKQAVSTVNQHFWNDTHGAHVTEVEMDDYLDEPSGFQNLMTSLGNIFTKAVNGVERILRSDTASGMVVYDGECAPDAQDLANHAVASFTSNGVIIGKESSTHTRVGTNSMSIMYDDDRLVSVTSNGTTASVYMGATDEAPGTKYTNRAVVRYLEMFRSGYVIVPVPDASGHYPLLDPEGQASEYFAVKAAGSDVYRVKDPDGDDFSSGLYAGIYTIEGEEDEFSPSIRLTPQDEVPGPVDIEGGNISVHAEDGVATFTGSIVGTGDITAQGDVADGIGTLDQVRQDSKNADNITSGTLSVSHGGTGKTTHTSNAVLTGNGTSAVKNVSTANGALYATSSGGAPSFGTLPIAQGGTGATTASAAVQALTGRTWDFGTNNTSDTWVPVATTVSGEARWQHRSIPTNVATTPTSLWSGNSNGNLTLSQSAANFTRITIYYRDNDNQYNSVDVYQPNGKLVLLASNWEGRFHKMRSVTISGTSVNTARAYQTDTVDNHTDATNLIYIIRVLGWKY